ncbi:helix-turn-helix transcriptional regulator [Candidatus Roizmanbacteria bacterium]|nr:helix-turn-helix transcriptional regulator [Candidatus Roizmanbacteria bacterium]
MEPNFSKMFGDRVKQLRESKSISIEDAAEKAHLSITTFKNLEEGKRNRITLSLSCDVAEAIGVTVKDIWEYVK